MVSLRGARRCFEITVLNDPQRCWAGDTRHQCADRNAKRRSRLGVGRPFDGDEKECRTLLVGKRDESLSNLTEAYMVILRRWNLLLNKLAYSRDALSFGATGPGSVDEDIVQDRHNQTRRSCPGRKLARFS